MSSNLTVLVSTKIVPLRRPPTGVGGERVYMLTHSPAPTHLLISKELGVHILNCVITAERSNDHIGPGNGKRSVRPLSVSSDQQIGRQDYSRVCNFLKVLEDDESVLPNTLVFGPLHKVVHAMLGAIVDDQRWLTILFQGARKVSRHPLAHFTETDKCSTSLMSAHVRLSGVRGVHTDCRVGVGGLRLANTVEFPYRENGTGSWASAATRSAPWGV